jgi:hypothetical protein
MKLAEFIAEPTRRRRLAAALSRSPDYLWQVATGWRGRRPSAELAIAIERETALIGPELVDRGSLRPDLWEPRQAELEQEGDCLARSAVEGEGPQGDEAHGGPDLPHAPHAGTVRAVGA